MKQLLLGLLLSGSAFGQTQTLAVPVNYSVSDLTSLWAIGDFLTPPPVPGRIVNMRWDVELYFSGEYKFVNGSSVSQVFDGTITGTLFSRFLGGQFHWGYWSHSLGSNVVPPGGQEVLPVWDVIQITGEAIDPLTGWNTTGGDLNGSFYLGAFTDPEYPGWQVCEPGGSNCWVAFGNGPGTFQNVAMTWSGTIYYDFEPELAGVTSVCDGDGAMWLTMYGDWQNGVSVVSNPVGEFSMLFMGPSFVDWPGTSFCVSGGSRLNDSLRWNAIDYDLDLATIVAGQTFSLQAVHRVPGGAVAFSNGLLAFPF